MLATVYTLLITVQHTISSLATTLSSFSHAGWNWLYLMDEWPIPISNGTHDCRTPIILAWLGYTYAVIPSKVLTIYATWRRAYIGLTLDRYRVASPSRGLPVNVEEYGTVILFDNCPAGVRPVRAGAETARGRRAQLRPPSEREPPGYHRHFH